MNKIKSKYYRTRSAWWRLNRLLFPSPAELKLIEIMGGKITRLEWLKHHQTKFCFAIVWSLGNAFKAENFEREKRVGKYFLDFGNDILWGVEVDGKAYHRDVVKQFDRDSYMYQRGWRVMHINAIRLWNEPAKVQSELLKFLNV